MPVAFGPTPFLDRLLLASDGLFDYADMPDDVAVLLAEPVEASMPHVHRVA